MSQDYATHVIAECPIGDFYRDDIVIEGGYLRDDCTKLYYGLDAQLPVDEQTNL